ncbi:hypothetical protein [Piscibacillus salipiscarius]|uniref:Uncharacterized protein n=1 Tax=Piscibacillus salipiscarius TaxID=299480 RepID=A0ABW5Q7B9_9BACI|nr:hypothetical protein [Piscibacillus salipiscarius]
MLSKYKEIFIYANKILANDQEIGRFRKRKGSPHYIQNVLYHLANYPTGVAVDLEIVNHDEEIIGYIRKPSGIRPKNFHIFNEDKEHLGDVQTGWTYKNINFMNTKGELILKMTGASSGIDFVVEDLEKDLQYSIRKRSLVVYGDEPNVGGEGFYITIPDDPVRTLMLIGLCYCQIYQMK